MRHQYDAVLYASPTLAQLRKRLMDYAEKLDRMDRHLQDHPHDYQTVIARLKVASRAIDYATKKDRDMRLKRLAEIRRKREKKHGSKQDE